jgi:hypothetical protein
MMQNKSQQEIEKYLRNYLTAELRVQGIFKTPLRVKVVQKEIDYSSQVDAQNKECITLGDRKYCVYEEVLSEIII